MGWEILWKWIFVSTKILLLEVYQYQAKSNSSYFNIMASISTILNYEGYEKDRWVSGGILDLLLFSEYSLFVSSHSSDMNRGGSHIFIVWELESGEIIQKIVPEEKIRRFNIIKFGTKNVPTFISGSSEKKIINSYSLVDKEFQKNTDFCVTVEAEPHSMFDLYDNDLVGFVSIRESIEIISYSQNKVIKRIEELNLGGYLCYAQKSLKFKSMIYIFSDANIIGCYDYLHDSDSDSQIYKDGLFENTVIEGEEYVVVLGSSLFSFYHIESTGCSVFVNDVTTSSVIQEFGGKNKRVISTSKICPNRKFLFCCSTNGNYEGKKESRYYLLEIFPKEEIFIKLHSVFKCEESPILKDFKFSKNEFFVLRNCIFSLLSTCEQPVNHICCISVKGVDLEIMGKDFGSLERNMRNDLEERINFLRNDEKKLFHLDDDENKNEEIFFFRIVLLKNLTEVININVMKILLF